MSSLRNAVKRVTHKERSQPASRSHLGILEKKKDYTARAKDYHRKEDRIKAMQQRAAMRNPDEFYFGMHKSSVVDGKHRRKMEFDDTAQLDAETIRIMKDQDVKYIRMQRQKDAKKVEKLQASLHHVGSTKNKHTIFVETQQEVQDFDATQHFDTLPELVNHPHNRLRVADLKKHIAEAAVTDKTKHQLQKESKRLQKAQAASYRELQERTKRVEAMRKAEAHLVTEQQQSAKGQKRKIKGAAKGEPAQYKWRRRRLG